MADATSNVQVVFEAINKAQSVLHDLKRDLAGLGAEQSKFSSSSSQLTGAQGALQKVLQGVNSSLTAQASQVRGVSAAMQAVPGAAALAIAAVVGLGVACVSAAKEIGDYQEQIDIMAETHGLAVSDVAALDVAASNVGRTVASVTPQLAFFSRNLAQAGEDSEEAAAKFRRFGISITDESENLRSTSDVLKDVSEKLRMTDDQHQRSLMMFQLFGRGGAAAYAILSQSIDENTRVALEKGILLTESQQKLAREADAANDKLKLSFTGLKNQILVSLAGPGIAIMNWATNTIDWLKKVKEEITERTIGAFRDLARAKAGLENAGQPVGQVTVGPITMSGYQPRTMSVPISEDLRKLQQQANDQLKALGMSIPLMDYQRSIGAVTLDQEVKKLESLKAQALTREEILRIEQKIASLNFIGGTVPGSRVGQSPIGPMPGPGFPFVPVQPPPSIVPKKEGELQVGDLMKPEVVKYLKEIGDRTGDWERTLRAASDAQGSLNEVTLGFIGTLQQAQLTALELGQSLAGSVVNRFNQAVDAFVAGTGDISSAFKGLVRDMLATILKREILGSILGFIGFGAGGGAGAIASGATFAAAGGTFGSLPIRARSGVNLAGVRGFDNIPGLWQSGETILSTGLTSKMERFMDDVFRGASMASGNQGGMDRTVEKTIVAPGAVVIQGGIYDEKRLSDLVVEKLASKIAQSQKSGGFR